MKLVNVKVEGTEGKLHRAMANAEISLDRIEASEKSISDSVIYWTAITVEEIDMLKKQGIKVQEY